MARRPRKSSRGETASPHDAGLPTQQDDADIVEELGAEPAEDDSGELVIDEETARREGAVDAESIRENRHAREVVDKKRGGVKNVTFNVNNALLKYEELSKLWPVSTMDILVTRLTGAQIAWTIRSRPKTAAELYEALKALHGRHEEAEYELKFRDSYRKESRGTARITLPDTRDELPPQQQGQPPMNPYYPPPPPPAPSYGPPYPQPPAAPYGPLPPQYPPPQYPPPQPMPQPQPAAAPQPPPMPPPGTDVNTARAWFELWQQMNPQAPPGVAPASAAPQQPQQPPPVPPPPGTVMYVPGFGYMQAVGAAPPQAPQQQPAPPQPAQSLQMLAGAMPPTQPPPGMVFVPGWGMVSMEVLAQAQAVAAGVAPPGRPGPPYRGPYAGPRPGYYPGGAPQEGPPSGPPMPSGAPSYGGYPGGPPQPPPPPRTAAEQFRDAITLVRSAVDAASQIQSILPGQQAQPEAPMSVGGEADDSPVSVMDVGGYKLVVDKASGSARKWETGVANLGSVLKWLGEQREAIQKSNAEQEAAMRRQKQQLPPGYVEVTPGYQPPPGYVAVPVDQIPADLPQPPAQLPPPIADEAPVRRTWDAPTIPGKG
jgi:hypothetical protein